jgi:hypothetical protein
MWCVRRAAEIEVRVAALRPDLLHDGHVVALWPLTAQHAVRDDRALNGLVLVMVRVDETGHYDHAVAVHDGGLGGLEVRRDSHDTTAFDQHVCAREVAEFRIHREHRAVLQQNPLRHGWRVRSHGRGRRHRVRQRTGG